MECAKCKFQFCWYCLDDFYTEYHYSPTNVNCPFRYCLLHSLEAAGLLLLFVKMVMLSPLAPHLYNLLILTMTILKEVLIQAAFLGQIFLIQKQYASACRIKLKKERAQKRMKGKINIPVAERRKVEKLEKAYTESYYKLKKRISLLTCCFILIGHFSERLGLYSTKLHGICIASFTVSLLALKYYKTRRPEVTF